MEINEVEYLYWAKNRAKVLFDLTQSGAPPVALADYGAENVTILTQEIGVYGHPDLIQHIAQAYHIDSDSVLPTPGTSSANFIAIAGATSRGDVVALEWPVYEPLLRVCEYHGLDTIKVRRGPGEYEQFEQVVRQGARAVVMTNLHNPTGRFADRSSIEALAALCRDYECHLIVDEAYLDLRHVLFDEPRWTAASLGDHVAATNSLTKVYGLGPLRVGWLIASGNVMNTARRLTDHMHVVNSAPSTGLGIVAWENIDRLTARTKSVYEQSWPVMSAWLEANPDVKTFGNDGALFQYLRLPEIDDTSVFAQLLFEDYGILVTPGRFFAQKDWLRIGFGIPPDDLAEALSHIDTARSSMTQPLG